MFQVFIDGEEMVCESNFEIQEEFMNPSHIELYKVFPKSWKGTDKLLTDYYYPEDYLKVNIYKDGELYFTGITKNGADMGLNPFKPHYCSVQILDPSTLLSEGETLDYVIDNKTVSEAISQVIASISDYGFVEGNINIPEENDTIIRAYSTLDKAPFDVFQYLALISESRWGTRMISEDLTAIDFYSPELLENLGTIETTKEYCSTNKIQDINYDYSTSDYRNKQVITSDEVFANISQKETIIANGYNTTYMTEQKIGSISSISVNGEIKTFATKEEKSFGITADFYYKITENQFESNEIYSAGTVINIEYIPLIQGREVAYNNGEITRIFNNINRKGIISRYENRNDVTSSKELQTIGKSYIKFKGIAEISLTIISRKDFLVLGGKYQFLSLVNKLNGEYLVKSKKTKVCQNGSFQQIIYEYELSNSFDTENELNYFDNQRAKNNGNIAQGEFISRNIDIESSVNIVFSDITIEEITTGNVIEGALEMPLNQ